MINLTSEPSEIAGLVTQCPQTAQHNDIISFHVLDKQRPLLPDQKKTNKKTDAESYKILQETHLNAKTPDDDDM